MSNMSNMRKLVLNGKDGEYTPYLPYSNMPECELIYRLNNWDVGTAYISYELFHRFGKEWFSLSTEYIEASILEYHLLHKDIKK